MKKNNIFNRAKYQRESFKSGWRKRSTAVKATSVFLLFASVTLCVWYGVTHQYSWGFIWAISAVSAFISYFTQVAQRQTTSNSMLAALSTENGDIAISGETLPGYVRKLVLGKDRDNNIAFIQLAWNSGDEWRFDIKEYDAVAEFFAQHCPDITLVKE